MNKKLDNLDFGFSLVDEDELKSLERELTKQNEQVSKIASTYKDKYETLHRLFMGLLAKMSEDPKKSYIHWPNRMEKINEMIRFINDLEKEKVSDEQK